MQGIIASAGGESFLTEARNINTKSVQQWQYFPAADIATNMMMLD